MISLAALTVRLISRAFLWCLRSSAVGTRPTGAVKGPRRIRCTDRAPTPVLRSSNGLALVALQPAGTFTHPHDAHTKYGEAHTPVHNLLVGPSTVRCCLLRAGYKFVVRSCECLSQLNLDPFSCLSPCLFPDQVPGNLHSGLASVVPFCFMGTWMVGNLASLRNIKDK